MTRTRASLSLAAAVIAAALAAAPAANSKPHTGGTIRGMRREMTGFIAQCIDVYLDLTKTTAKT
mgnify:CR=1 FL=1